MKPLVIPGRQATADTSIQRVLGRVALPLNQDQRLLLKQRNPYGSPLNFPTTTTSNRFANGQTMTPDAIPERRTIGAWTRVARMGKGVGPAPDYPQNSPKALGVTSDQLQSFGIPTIRVGLASPPQGGGVPGWNNLLIKGMK